MHRERRLGGGDRLAALEQPALVVLDLDDQADLGLCCAFEQFFSRPAKLAGG